MVVDSGSMRVYKIPNQVRKKNKKKQDTDFVEGEICSCWHKAI